MLLTLLMRYCEELKASESVKVQVQPGAQTSLPRLYYLEEAGKMPALPALAIA